MPTLLNPDEGNLTASHASEAVSEEDEGPLVVHDEILWDFALLIQVDELAIVKARLMLVLNSVCVFCERSFSFLFSHDHHGAITVDIFVCGGVD